MEKWFSMPAIEETVGLILEWARTHILTLAAAQQVGILLLALLASGWLGRRISHWCESLMGKWPPYRHVSLFIDTLTQPIAALIVIGLGDLLLSQLQQPTKVLGIAVSLLVAWIAVRFASNFIRNKALANAFAVAAWSIAALNILGWLQPLIAALEGFGFDLGKTRLSAYSILAAIITAALLIWGALILARVSERQLSHIQGLNPSLRVLFGKITRIVLLSIAILVAMASAGIDLTAFAVFSGALGVGIGFGLQKVVSNFISGVILLLDRSIKPGDVIEIGETYGWINALAARYTSVVTRDGKEFLIPNEDIITQQVVNWSHSDRNVRQRIPVQVAYSSDIKKAMKLMVEAATGTDRVLKHPPPVTLIRGFGSDGVDLELRLWIDDPYNGVANVSSQVMERIWDMFHDNDISFPFPQRDHHLAPETLQAIKAIVKEARGTKT